MFNVKSSGAESLPDLETSDIPAADIGRFDAFGVDPGHRYLFTAVNMDGSCTRFSNNKWYQKAGFTKRRRNQQRRKRDQNIDVIESSLPTKKTSDYGTFLEYCEIIFLNLPELLLFYGSDYSEESFLKYVGSQKMANEVVNTFLNASKKYRDRDHDE
jgi:hypothetical protein